MLLTETVILKWNSKIVKHYINKGYKYTKLGDKFKVKVNDLTNGSNVLVEVKCDCKNCENPYLTPIKWQNYLRCVKEDGKYYCQKCATKLFGSKKSNKTKLDNSDSFEQWCIKNNRQDILDKWDYELNECKPSEIGYSTHKKYYFKCPKGKHKSELKNINNFTGGSNGVMDCIACNSFAQWGINNIGVDFLEKYWDYEKNIVNPWEISFASGKKVWIKCQEKDYHGSYDISSDHFINGKRCSYCVNRKIHPIDSLGKILECNNLLSVWSNKNKKSPYEYAPMSDIKVWWKCFDGKHNDFKRSICSSNIRDFRCPECNFSKGEAKISEILMKLNFSKISQEEYSKIINNNSHKYYIPQKEFKGLIGLGGGLLSYDFYLPQHNLLIEFQGKQHEIFVKWIHKIKKAFKKQQEHDRRKREYAKTHNIKLLEIWYYDFDNIEEILNKELNL
jgi:hypothetical protein